MPTLTKTAYLHFLRCPRYLWLSKHQRHTVHKPLDLGIEWLIEEGHKVEAIAQTLFPSGTLIKSFYERGATDTLQRIEEGKKCLFQATAFADDLLAMADILQFDPETNAWDIYEVKSTTQVKDEHLHDVCFQKIAFERTGYTIGKIHVVHINRDYVRSGRIDPSGFLTIEEVTDRAAEIEQDVEAGIVQAKNVLALADEPTPEKLTCNCSPKNCPCLDHCFPDLPDHSVFYLRGITAKKARSLYENGIRTIVDVPDGTKLNKTQQNQVIAAKQGSPIIDAKAIKKTLDSLTYPLYFFDYETFSAAIPDFEDFTPNQVMPFQYSLHVLRSPDAEPEHCEYLAANYENTIPSLIASLHEHIGDSGTVIVWNKSFEMGCNDDMGFLYPTEAPFLASINNRIFDLMEIFTKQHYVDARFDGSCSIKKVLPVIVPALSYEDLHIHEGVTASISWYRMFSDEKTDEERQQTRGNLLKYCQLDTLAMVEIFKQLNNV